VCKPSGNNGTHTLSCITRGISSTSVTLLQPNDEPPSARCSFCPSPHTGKILKLGSSFQPENFQCLRCTCDKSGSVSCKYGVEELTSFSKCKSLERCEKFIEEFKNGTRPYTCNKCADRLEQNAVMIRPTYAEWKIQVWGHYIRCVCLNTGEIVCVTNTVNVYSVQSKGYCRNCTKMKAKQFITFPEGK